MVQYYVRFQASTGGLGTYPLWSGGTTVFPLDSTSLAVLILNCSCSSELSEELFQKAVPCTLVQNKSES